MFSDLREFIQKVEESGDCKLVEGADWNLEIGAISHLSSRIPNSPMLMFDRIKGYKPGYRVVTNLFSTHKRTALALGLPPEARGTELVRAVRDKIKNAARNLLPPVEVESGPVKENILSGAEVDLFKFPAPKWNELDGGRYIGTGSICVTRDPDEGWINLGTYRAQIHDKSTITLSMVPGRHGKIMREKYWARGLNCPVAISCGQEPVLWAASIWDGTPWGLSEYDFAGALRGKPVEVTRGVTTDLPIPATAEIVLEGEIVPPEVESRDEGPLGEWPGYYTAGVRAMPAVRIKSILHRNNPIIQGNPPNRFPSIYTLGTHLQKAAQLWNELDRQIPGVRGVWIVEEASTYGILVISLKQSYPGHAKQAGLLAAGSSSSYFAVRLVVVVDDDIDPSNIPDVLWALGTRVEPDTSIDIVRGCLGGATDVMLSPEKKKIGNYEMSRAIILACKPYHWIKDFPQTLEPSKELAKRIKEKWGELLS